MALIEIPLFVQREAAYVATYSSGKIATLTATVEGSSWRITFTWTGDDLTSWTKWVKI